MTSSGVSRKDSINFRINMEIQQKIQRAVSAAIQQLYGENYESSKVQVNLTPKEFAGNYTVVVFPFVRIAKKSPDQAAVELGDFLKHSMPEIAAYNVVKGFLNLSIAEKYWHQFLSGVVADTNYGRKPRSGKKVMVEYSSPNTNKPLHLGHIRNILLGWSAAQLLDAVGYDVVRVQIINDRGIAICKSMYAWKTWGKGKTPQSEGIKSDHFVGEYYVLFEKKNKQEYEKWQKTPAAQMLLQTKKKPEQDDAAFWSAYKNKWFNEHSRLGATVRKMLLKWEAGDPSVRALWQTLNHWVYEGFHQTYQDLKVEFDKLYYESDTYLLGKEIVEEGLKKNIFFKKEDGSVWIDLTDAGHDQKLLLRSDGTSVYMTQDLGTARLRYLDFGCEKMVYVVADEQNYHFAVLFEILKRLGEPYAAGLHHLSYGLVELPSGRMKTREGTVVDADDLIAEVFQLAHNGIRERGEISSLSEAEQASIARKIGMAALKFFMIKVHPKKKMIFNPDESVDLQGQTGPYIQYSYVRIHGLMKRIQKGDIPLDNAENYHHFQQQELELLTALQQFPGIVQQAAEELDPSHLANYCYDLAKSYHKFWHDLSIIHAETDAARAFRLKLSAAVGQVLASGMHLLGIEMPERM